ncbi:MAG: hypothetical protein WCH98_03410 [Verrucomicrobiota bacterium]
MKTLIAIATIVLFGLAGVSRAADQAPIPYPLTTCFISGDKLGEMGKPFVFTYQGQELKLCCKDCKKKFDKNPEKAMKDFQDAVKNAGKASPAAMDPNMKM